jgi:PhoPQ-activated pathogenicity-related protein
MIQPYTNRGLQRALESELGDALRQVVDPYAYIDDLTEPKLVVLGTNDPYWPVNAANLYFDALQGPKYLLYIPNAGHGLIDGDASRVFGGVLAFHRAARGAAKLPAWNWKHADAAEKSTIELTWKDKPIAVRVWRAESTDRDFRDEKWKAVDVKDFDDAGTTVELARPTNGYAATFAEVEYPGVSVFPARFSTTMKVLGSDPAFSTP